MHALIAMTGRQQARRRVDTTAGGLSAQTCARRMTNARRPHLCVGVCGWSAIAGVCGGSTVARIRCSRCRGAVRLTVAGGSTVAAIRGLLHRLPSLISICRLGKQLTAQMLLNLRNMPEIYLMQATAVEYVGAA